LSSTTDRSRGEGQVLVLFAGALLTLLIVAALAFDVGMLLVERRDQQDAADAAALAGARYVLTNTTTARTAARDIARLNGFDDADPNQVVNVYIPPIHGRYVGFPGFIEVQIESTRPSIFGGVIGKANWPVGAFAVATNSQNLTFPFGMLALNPTACKAIQVTGTGVVNAYANVQSNSNGSGCTSGGNVGFSRTGGSTVNVLAPDATCRSVGLIQDQGSGSMTCTQVPNSFALPDPLRNLPAPPKPALASAMHPIGHTMTPPANCPGGTPAPSESSPRLCALSPTGAYKNKAWVLFPGLYPGGLDVDQGTTAYLMPGIYWIGGGGLAVATNGSIFTVGAETDAKPTIGASTWGGGVLIYNSKLPGSAGGPIDLNGSAATMKLKPFHVDPPNTLNIYNDIVIFQDRTVTATVTLNGASSTTFVNGIVYVPGGQVKLNGNGGFLTVDQIIADTYLIDGGGGRIDVLHGLGLDAVIVAAGLVD
jgi:Putative Flp pilus-assembly TadE/G-like